MRYNRQSNDSHIEVIDFILSSKTLPDQADCWECYQPKFFHYSAAKILQITNQDELSPNQQILTVELINFAAGLLTIIVAGLLITRLAVKSETLKILSFGLVALNPELIGINSQATNDTFVILFSTLALYNALLFLQKHSWGTILLSFLFTSLAISSKTNGWIIGLAIPLALIMKALTRNRRPIRLMLIGLAFFIASLGLSILNPLNQYVSNFTKYGSPFVTNISSQPLPYFFKKTSTPSPGILSIQDGIFTFKYFDLLRYPRIENGDSYPDHRTSLWTQLYGRAHSIHFANWPESWSTTGDQGFTLSRAIYVLALLPTLLLLFGAILEIGVLLKGLFKRDEAMVASTHFGLGVLTFIGYIAFIIAYALLYRESAVMKVIFIYPALLTFPLFFMRACEFIDFHLKNNLRWLRPVFTLWIVTIFILYAADVITMIQLIYSRRQGL